MNSGESGPVGDRPQTSANEGVERRSFIAGAAMAGGVVASYGTFAAMAARYLYPAGPQARAWQLVCELDRIEPGGTFEYRTPAGEPVTITRSADEPPAAPASGGEEAGSGPDAPTPQGPTPQESGAPGPGPEPGPTAVSAFRALSSTCPHLGCRVHWEPQNERFFCPCHNGIFTPEGEPVAGPPADAGQSLSTFPLKVEGGLLFIEVPMDPPVGSVGSSMGNATAALEPDATKDDGRVA